MGKKHFTLNLSFTLFLSLILFMISLSKITAQTITDQQPGKPIAHGLLSFKDKNRIIRPVTTKDQWEIKREQILDSMQAVMGTLPDRSNLPDFDIKITDSLKSENYTRYTLIFSVASNEILSAYLLIPFRINRHLKLPAMLVLHETDDKGKKSVDGGSTVPNRAYARELADRGYIVIAPDYPGFGDSKDYDFDHDRYESGTMKGIFNHIRCVDLLQTREDVDPERIGVIGHSLGGHNAMFMTAFDKRIKVVVSSCGWTLFNFYNAGEEVSRKFGGRLGPWAQKRYMPLFLDKYKQDGNKTPFDFDEVIAAIAPRPFFSNSPLNDSNFDVKGVKTGIENVSQIYCFLKAEGNLQVLYPESGHDFPPEVRLEAYRFIDKVLKHTPSNDKIE